MIDSKFCKIICSLLVIECLPVRVKRFYSSFYLMSSIVIAINKVFTGLNNKNHEQHKSDIAAFYVTRELKVEFLEIL